MFRWSAVQMNFSKQSGFFAMIRSSEFLMYFHKQAGSGFESGSGSEIKVKVGSGSRKNNFGSPKPMKIINNPPPRPSWCHWHRWVTGDTAASTFQTHRLYFLKTQSNQIQLWVNYADKGLKAQDSALSLTPPYQLRIRTVYLGEFAVMCENTLRCENVGQGRTDEKKLELKKSRETIPLRAA